MDPVAELDVLGQDGDALGVDGAQVGVLQLVGQQQADGGLYLPGGDG